MGRVNLKAGDDQIEAWKAAAEREERSLSAWARRTLDRRAEQTAEVGPEYDTPETVAVKAQQARAVMEAAEAAGRSGEGEQRGAAGSRAPDPPPEPEPPAAEAPARIDEGSPHAEPYDVPADPEPQVTPDPKQAIEGAAKLKDVMLKKPSLKDVLKSGTVSGTQSVKALEAARMKQAREEAFSMVCPLRDKHVPGARCPHCHGIA